MAEPTNRKSNFRHHRDCDDYRLYYHRLANAPRLAAFPSRNGAIP